MKTAHSSSHLIVHVAQHKVQQEGLALAKGPGHRHNHHIQVLQVILQQDLLQRCSVQLKTVLILVGQDNLDGPGLFFLYCSLRTRVCNQSGLSLALREVQSDFTADDAGFMEDTEY